MCPSLLKPCSDCRTHLIIKSKHSAQSSVCSLSAVVFSTLPPSPVVWGRVLHFIKYTLLLVWMLLPLPTKLFPWVFSPLVYFQHWGLDVIITVFFFFWPLSILSPLPLLPFISLLYFNFITFIVINVNMHSIINLFSVYPPH